MMFSSREKLLLVSASVLTLNAAGSVLGEQCHAKSPPKSKSSGQPGSIPGKPGSRFEVLGLAKVPTFSKSLPPKAKVIESFPAEFAGNWGGVMQIWSYQISALYGKLDADESNGSLTHLKKGRVLNVNFNFVTLPDGSIRLEPIKMLMYVPAMESKNVQEMMVKQPPPPGIDMNSIKLPLSLEFGNSVTNEEKQAVGGGQFVAEQLTDRVTAIDGNIYEQQGYVRFSSQTVKSGIDENVFWFKVSPDDKNKLVVKGVSVKFDSRGNWLSKLIVNGLVTKGEKVDMQPRRPW